MEVVQQFDIWTFLSFFFGVLLSLGLDKVGFVRDWFDTLSSNGKFIAVLVASLVYAFFKAVGQGELGDGVLSFIMVWVGATLMHKALPKPTPPDSNG